MTQQIESTEDKLTIRQTYDARPAKVYAALTTRDIMERWYAPGIVSAFEPEVGGRFAVRWLGPDGKPMGGFDCTFTELVPGKRVVHTFRMLDDPAQPEDSLVRYELEERNGKTRLTFTHERLSKTGIERGKQGWASALGRLADLIPS